MTPIRSTKRTSYTALMVFGIVYIATLAIVFAPESLRASTGGQSIHLVVTNEGAPDVFLRP